MNRGPGHADEAPACPAADLILELYQRHADAWCADRLRGGFPEQAWLARFLSILPGSGAVLDLGCGCGRPVAAWLVEQGRAITGVDGAKAMIDRCRAEIPAQTWLHADMRTLDIGRQFAGVLAWDSFFHLKHADQRAMFAVFARHAAPGAALMFNSGTSRGVAMGNLRGEPLYHASHDHETYRALLADSGFDVIDQRSEDPGCGLRSIWLARRRLG